MYFVPHALCPLHMLRALTWITLRLIWLDRFPTFVSYKLAWQCIYFGNQPVLCKSVSLILQERDIKGSVSVSNNEDKYLYFHNFWTSLFMASSQIMRSLLRQEHADVIKFLTRLVRAWKNSSEEGWSCGFAIDWEFSSTGLSSCLCHVFPMWPCMTLPVYICFPKTSCCRAYKSPRCRGPLAVGCFVQEFWLRLWGVAEAMQMWEQQQAFGSICTSGLAPPCSKVMRCTPEDTWSC